MKTFRLDRNLQPPGPRKCLSFQTVGCSQNVSFAYQNTTTVKTTWPISCQKNVRRLYNVPIMKLHCLRSWYSTKAIQGNSSSSVTSPPYILFSAFIPQTVLFGSKLLLISAAIREKNERKSSKINFCYCF